MSDLIPELVYRSAEKAVARFCLEPVVRSGQEYHLSREPLPEGFEIRALPAGQKESFALARLHYTPEIEQWTLHRPLEGDRWSFIPEIGGTLDLNRLLGFLRNDPLNLFRW